MLRIVIYLFSFLLIHTVFAQDADLIFISYGTLQTWSGVAVDWNVDPKVHIYDTSIYKGHSEFVARGLGRKIRFAEFKKLSMESKNREYLPFFVYDLKSKPFKNKSGTFNWALRLENYNYDDKPEHLAEDIVRLSKIISGLDKNFSSKGLIILTEEKNSPLSAAKLGIWLKKSSVSFLKLNSLIKHVGGKKISVLNSGTAYGLVKLIKKEKELEKLLPSDIAILDFTPTHIPPVAGILSLKPQTPLSHLNLLAKNRGTFNAYIPYINALPNLKKLIGKYAKLYNEEDKILIQKISKKEVDEYHKNNPPKQIIIPEMKIDLEDIIGLSKENEKFISTSNIGAKATNYYLLFQTLPELTRPSYAIGFKYYLEAIKGEPETLIQNLLKYKSKFSKEDTSKSLTKIRVAILKSNSIPVGLITSIRKVLDKYPPSIRIRLRSSTNNEDLPEFNGAGLYESNGFNKKDSDDKLKEKILAVYASLWSEKAYHEREYFGIDHNKVGMSLLVHEAFRKEAANGVIVTSLNKDNQIQMIVNAQSGEHSVTKPEENLISESFLLNSENATVQNVYSESSLSPVFIGNKTNASLLKTLQESTLQLHSHFIKHKVDPNDKSRYGIDIEFKIMNEKGKNKLYFKQVRLLKY